MKWMLMVSTFLLCAPQATNAQYMYSDNFETNQLEEDALDHSPIFENPPDISLHGYLRWVFPATRAVAFVSGLLVGADPFLTYRFPL